MADNDLQLQLSIETDASIAKAIKDMESISKESSEIEKGLAKISRQKAFDDLARDAARLAVETGDSAQATRLLAREMDKLGAKENDVERIVKQYQRLQTEIKQTASAQDRFDATSRDVALAGDVQSNLGALSGLAGAAGASGASQALGIGGEIVVLAEELPRLKEAVSGLPDVAKSAAQALNTNVLSLGALGVAIAALTAVIAIGRAEAEKSRKALEELYEARRNERETLSDLSQLTNEELRAKREELQLKADVARANADEARSIEEGLDAQNAFIRGAGELSSVLGIGSQVYKVAGEQAELTAEELAKVEGELALIDQTLESGANAAANAKQAEEELAQAREQAAGALIAEAAAVGDLLELRLQALDFNEEELAAEIKKLEVSKQVLEAELAALQALDNGSEAVKQQLEQLQGQINQVGKSIETLNSQEVKGAAAANTAREAEEKLRKEREKSTKTTRTTATTEKRSGGGFRLPGTGRPRIGGATDIATLQRLNDVLSDDINAEFEDGSKVLDSVALKDLGIRDIANDFAKAANEAGEALKEGIYDVRQSLIQGIEDLRIGQGRDIEDARRTGSILAIRDITRNAERAGEDINRQAKRDSIRIERDYNQDIMRLQQDRNTQILQAFDNMLQEMASKVNSTTSRTGGGGFRFARVARS